MKILPSNPKPTREQLRAQFDALCDLASRITIDVEPDERERHVATNLHYLDKLVRFISEDSSILARQSLDAIDLCAPTLDETAEARRARIAAVRAGGLGQCDGGSLSWAIDMIGKRVRHHRNSAAPAEIERSSSANHEGSCCEETHAFVGAVSAFRDPSSTRASPPVLDRSRPLYVACEYLRTHHANPSGSNSDELAGVIAFLRGRLRSWVPTGQSDPRHAYDEAMRSLCEAALALSSQ